MTDASQYYSSDLDLSAVGDLLAVDSLEYSKQRILRRLLTNPGDYIWQPTYGAGIPSYIGKTLDVPAITGLIKAQMYQEASVSHNPEPQISVQTIPGGIAAQIQYTEQDSGFPTTLSFTVTP